MKSNVFTVCCCTTDILYDFIDIYMHKKLPRRMKFWDRSAVGINWKIND